MRRYAIYRILYGEDFIQESITSIQKYVDRVLIFWTTKPFGSVSKVVYKGKTVQLPKKFDNVLEKIRELNLPHVDLIPAHYDNNDNQFTDIVNNRIIPHYPKPGTVIIIESDMVFRDDQATSAIEEFESSKFQYASTDMIELWKTPYYRCSEDSRKHMGVVFWNLNNLNKMPPTRKHANLHFPPPRLKSFVHNFGFCFSEKNMYWRILAAIAYSRYLKDSLPNEDWYEDVWLAWDYEKNNKNLEISKKHSHLIPRAVPYDVTQLPESIRRKYSIEV
jgi:hypothetical protein